jgi:hypothetical protein
MKPLRLLALFLAAAALPALASTVLATAECSNGQERTRTTYGEVLCDWAIARVEPTFVMAQAISGTGFSGSSSASLQDQITLTISGGTGSGFYLPCFAISTDFAHASLGTFTADVAGNTCSGGFGAAQSLPFAFDTPIHANLNMSATGLGSAFFWGGGSASLEGFLFFDDSGDPLSGVTYVLTTTPPANGDVPEPGVMMTIGLGLLALAVFKIRSKV